MGCTRVKKLPDWWVSVEYRVCNCCCVVCVTLMNGVCADEARQHAERNQGGGRRGDGGQLFVQWQTNRYNCLTAGSPTTPESVSAVNHHVSACFHIIK